MTDTISARITARMRDLREAQGITRDELAAAARTAGAPESFTTAALRNLEIGRRSVAVDELVAVAAALGVSPRELLDEFAALFDAEQKPEDLEAQRRPVEASVRAAVQALDGLDGHQLALAQSAYALARQLDAGVEMTAAAVARELRATLTEIWAALGPDEDDEDDLGAS